MLICFPLKSATLIAGRYVEIKMLPLSFKEYVGSTGNNSELARKYTSYIENSSFHMHWSCQDSRENSKITLMVFTIQS